MTAVGFALVVVWLARVLLCVAVFIVVPLVLWRATRAWWRRRRGTPIDGEQLASPIEIAHADDVAEAGSATRCACGGARLPAATAPEEIRLGERTLLATRFECMRCGASQPLYFHPRASSGAGGRRGTRGLSRPWR